MIEEKAGQLIEYYAQQIVLYEEMLAIVKEQHLLCEEADFAKEEDLNKLNQLLFKRQKKMDLIEENQEKVQAIKKSLQDELDLEELNIKILCRYFPSPQTSRLMGKIEEIEALLKEIAELDQKTQKLLLVKLNLVQQETGKVQKSKKINRAYNPVKRQREGFFIDHNK
jgi:hypothetical protein